MEACGPQYDAISSMCEPREARYELRAACPEAHVQAITGSNNRIDSATLRDAGESGIECELAPATRTLGACNLCAQSLYTHMPRLRRARFCILGGRRSREKKNQKKPGQKTKSSAAVRSAQGKAHTAHAGF